MGNTRRKRVLIVSSAIILLCMIIIVGMSMALFTDSKRIRNHLQAGNLEIGLARTYLEYSSLDDYGRLAVTKVEGRVDFTGMTDKNVFGVDATGVKIVPGSYFKAEMELSNKGNVAFTYNLGIQLVDVPNALTNQLQVTITDHEGKVTTMKLSEMAKGVTINAGEMTIKDKAQKFTVMISFIDDIEHNKNLAAGEKPMDNNLAQTQGAVFDLIVTAVQATTAATTAPATGTTAP